MKSIARFEIRAPRVPPSGLGGDFVADDGSPRPRDMAETQLLLDGLDGLAHGVAVIDDDSRLVYSNLTARSTLMKAGWSLQHGVARSARAAEHAAWVDALGQVCRRGRRSLFELSGSDGAGFVGLLPVVANGLHRAFATFGRRELCGVIEVQMFASRYGLTAAESQVLRLLVAGMAPASIARANGVAVSTVQSQVASVRAKTQSSSVRHLLAKLSRMPPLQPTLIGVDCGLA